MTDTETAVVIAIAIVLVHACLLRSKARRGLSRGLANLRKTFPTDKFALLKYLPFLVVTDEDPSEVMARLKSTVPWAIQKLRNTYSWKEPKRTIGIWLFADRAHYDACEKLFWGGERQRVGGRFLQRSNSILADISLGNGVLVHETVHAFIHTNFPRCPPWFNEGLASLYNRCCEVDGEMRGCPDASAAALQSAILSGRTVPFKRLCSLSYNQFHGARETTNYAQSRYLCYYLQERGLLKQYYRAFRANHRKDPTGYNTLIRLVGHATEQHFEQDWETMVLAITHA